MKKKLLSSVFGLIAFMLFVTNVGAASRAAKIPSAIPDENDPIYAVVDEGFDFSKIKFTSANGGSDITGHSIMKKIILTANPVTTGTTLDTAIGESWFTAYCLDGNSKFPEYNTLSFGSYASATNTVKMYYNILFALYNNKELYNVFESVKGYEFSGATPVTYTINDGLSVDEAMAKLVAGEEVKVKVQSISYANIATMDTKTITAADLAKDSSATDYEVTVKAADTLFSNYSAKGTTEYNHALWIIEHSYPTLSIQESLELAGADYYKTLADILLLNGLIRADDSAEDARDTYSTIVMSLTALGSCSDAYKPLIADGLNKKGIAAMFGKTAFAADGSDITPEVCGGVIKYYSDQVGFENYIYSTVQYAIWNANGGVDANGNKLGDTLKGSTQLNTLYQYLIKDRSEYNNYSKFEFSNTIGLNKPEAGKEIANESKEAYTYGPYSVSHSLISIGSINVSVVGDTKGVSIVDKDGNAISEVKAGEQFYIRCTKADKVANVSIKLSSNNAKTYYPSSNRGRIYYANSPLLQNVVSGGKIVNVNVEQSFELIYNPKTGVENVAIIFVIALIAFSLGYLALSYKNKPVELN